VTSLSATCIVERHRNNPLGLATSYVLDSKQPPGTCVVRILGCCSHDFSGYCTRAAAVKDGRVDGFSIILAWWKLGLRKVQTFD
jgi:hypothetical protein